jgi:hypothetical protein
MLAAEPNGGELRVESKQLPRFSLFGSSALTRAPHASADDGAAAAAAAAADREHRKVDVILVPLSAAAKGPARHEGAPNPTGFDARWWGVALSLGALGLLMVGASLAALKM